jgi:aryl-alcohol dehydrogenase-like predicted oxidoreductase
MRITPIPNTDLSPSALCLGTGDFGGSTDRDTAFYLLDSFRDYGGSFLDTAKVYNDWIPGERSRSEKTIGAWLKQRGGRDQTIVATKGAHFDLATPHISRVTPEDITADIEASLQHLQTGWIDLYWLHRDDPTRPVSEILETLDRHAAAGKIRYYGCSNWRVERIREAQAYAASHHLTGFVAVQNYWNLAKINPSAISDPTIVLMDEALWQLHQQTHLAAIPFTSQANGLFQKMAAGGITSLSPHLQKLYLNPVTERRYQRLQVLRDQTGLSVTQIVLAYLLSQPFPTIPVFSTRRLAHLEEALTAADVRLSEDQLAFLLS